LNDLLGGRSGWSYADLLPYFTSMERNTRLGPPYHGRNGTLIVGDPGRIDPMARAYMEGIQSLGIPYNPDFNGERQAGVGPMQHTYGRGGRSSAVHAFLSQVRGDPRLTILTEALATRLIIERGRAVGVEYARNGHVVQVRAEGEVLVAAGTYNTAKFLMLSGIGPAAHLREQEVAVNSDLPGVGENLQDHHEVPVISAARSRMGYYGQDRGWRMLRNGLQYLLTHTGPVATTGVECCAFFDPDGGERPTIQLYFVPTVYLDRDVKDVAATWGCTLTPCLLRPKARGTVRLRSADPKDKPLVDCRFFGHPDDLRLTLAAMRFARRVLTAAPLAGLIAREMLPGQAAQSDNDLAGYAKRMVKTNYHPVGTARMGPPNDTMAVLDERLRVRGVEALRVIDCAVVPFIPSGNTNALALALGSRAVALIRGENTPPLTAEATS
jgi:choline dehydrogenase